MPAYIYMALGALALFLVQSCMPSTSPREDNLAVAGDNRNHEDTCDNPDAHINCSFIGMPQNLTSTMIIAAPEEQGERLILTGRILKADSTTPYPGVILYCYHTDGDGYYLKTGNETGVRNWHGRLHGWCKTDNDGRYEIQTIRPDPYPVNLFPAHIHTALKMPDRSTPFLISDFVFSDDPLVDEKYASLLKEPVGGMGIVDLNKDDRGIWRGVRDIVLD